MRRVAAALALLLAAAVAGLPWVLGGEARRLYQGVLAEETPPGLRLVGGRYERGWRESRAVALFAPAADASGEGPRLRLTSRIVHGPLDLDGSGVSPMLVRIESRVEGGPLPLSATTRVSLDGAVRVRVQPGGAPDGTPAEGLGTLDVDPRSGDVRGRVDLPDLRVGPWIDLSGLRGELDARRGAAGIPAGHLWLSARRLGVRDGGMAIEAEAAEIALEVTPAGGMLSVRGRQSAGRLVLGGVAYGPASAQVAVDGIPAGAAADLFAAAAGVAAGPGTAADLGAVLAAHLPRLLCAGAGLAVERLEAATADGPLTLRLRLSLPGLDATALQAGGWLSRLEGDGELDLPRPLLARLMGVRQDGPPAERERQQRLLDRLVRERWLEERGGRLGAVLRVGSGLVTVNGRTVAVSPPGLSQHF